MVTPLVSYTELGRLGYLITTLDLEYLDSCSRWRPYWQNSNSDCSTEGIFMGKFESVKVILVGDVLVHLLKGVNMFLGETCVIFMWYIPQNGY